MVQCASPARWQMTWYSSSAQAADLVVDQLDGKVVLLGQFLLGRGKTLPDAFFRLGAAAPQTALQLLLRGRQQEDRGCTGVHPADIGRAVHVDDQHHQLACVEALVDLFFQGTIVVAVIEVVLHYFIVLQ